MPQQIFSVPPLGAQGQSQQQFAVDDTQWRKGAGKRLEKAGKQGVLGLNKALNNFQAPALNSGLNTLLDILNAQGRTDPAALNRDLLAISRDTEAQQQALSGNAAMRGMQNSGVANAINAAVGAAGGDRASLRMTQETALAEERKRQDVMNILNLLIQSTLAAGGVGINRELAGNQNESMLQGAALGGISSALAPIFGNIGKK